MEKIPENLRNSELTKYLEKNGLPLIHEGKVRNTFQIDNDRLLIVATDRISIFDFVLNAEIPRKGEVLTALTHFWLTGPLKEYKNHLIYSEMGDHTNQAYDLQFYNLWDLPIERCLVVQNLSGLVWSFEMIYRYHLGGSVYKKYLATGKAGGHELPRNLPQWSKLNEPIFTPSTKEEVGHDVNVDVDYFFAEMKKANKDEIAHEMANELARLYYEAYAYAKERGILILDTKFEVADRIIIDEILTPDSSRFAEASDWEQAMKEGRDPYFKDKQPVREWGKKIATPFGVTGIDKLKPENEEHISFVHGLVVSDEIIKDCAERYLWIFEKLTGESLDSYQKRAMGV